MHAVYMVMGVSGCGKSTVGAGFAKAIQATFLDGDDYHPASNVDHMAAGHPLTDAMRWPWLDALGDAVTSARQLQPVVFACSALKKTYRDRLCGKISDLQIIYLISPRDVVAARLGARTDHFMPATLLDSQFATLEEPENCFAQVSIDQPVSEIIASLSARL